jgi:hypothetical protein
MAQGPNPVEQAQDLVNQIGNQLSDLTSRQGQAPGDKSSCFQEPINQVSQFKAAAESLLAAIQAEFTNSGASAARARLPELQAAADSAKTEYGKASVCDGTVQDGRVQGEGELGAEDDEDGQFQQQLSGEGLSQEDGETAQDVEPPTPE